MISPFPQSHFSMLTTLNKTLSTTCSLFGHYLRLITTVIIISTCVEISAQNWNIATGGNALHNGLSAVDGPVDETLLWSGGLPSAIAKSVVSDSIYLATVRIHNLSNALEGSKIVMMHMLTGDTLWTRNLPVDFPSTDWTNKISALHDGVLYASRSGNSNQAYLYALDAATGTILWRSEDLIDESSTEGANFLADGDLIVGNIQSILRINKDDGSTVWQNYRLGYQDGAELAIHNEKIYGIINDMQQLKVGAFDATDGQLLYSSEATDNGLIQQHGLFVATDGTIYLPRSQNNPITDFLYSLTDTGESIEQNWRIPLHYVPFSTSACGPDGSIYSYSRSGRVMRIDPDLGIVTDSSEVILFGDASYPRMVVDNAGRVNVTNGGFSDGNFYSFNADLSLRWQTPVSGVFIGGPIIGLNGTLVICGIANDIRAYVGESDETSVAQAWNTPTSAIHLFPNPAQNRIELRVIPTAIGTRYTIFDCIGKTVLSNIVISEVSPIDLSRLQPGIYSLMLENDSTCTVKFIKE